MPGGAHRDRPGAGDSGRTAARRTDGMLPLSGLDVVKQQEARMAGAEALLGRRARSGANWFYWIAGLTALNSVLALSGSQTTFLSGLFVTQLIDAFGQNLAADSGPGGPTLVA